MSTAAPAPSTKPTVNSSTATPSANPSLTAGKTGYDVSPSHGKCFVSGRAIQPGEKFVTALRETSDGFERIDVTLEHWPQFDQTGVIAFWQTTLRRPEQKKKQFVDDQVLCELFDRLGDATGAATGDATGDATGGAAEAEPGEANKVRFRFVLGLILMRKRLLIYEGTRTDGDRSIWSVRAKGRDKAADLLDPRMDEQEMLQVSGQLGQILNEGQMLDGAL